jgi:hypothetical protein
VSSLQVCTPGAQFPPSTTLPSAIIIGDSVSEGYQPVVSANVSKAVFMQHSPWSVGGGADDVFNGLNCECGCGNGKLRHVCMGVLLLKLCVKCVTCQVLA